MKPSFLIGEWDGGSLDTGHPGHKALAQMRWAGKSFRSVDDADPILVWDDEGKRVWDEEWGHSSVSSFCLSPPLYFYCPISESQG